MGLLLIIPILALEIWLILTTGKRVCKELIASRRWAKFALLIVVGLALGVWLFFYVEYNMGKQHRIASFPVPTAFFSLEDNKWVDYIVPQPFLSLAIVTDFLTGLIMPLIPFKIAEFIKTVKQELH